MKASFLFNSAIRIRGGLLARSLDRMASNPRESQANLLMGIIRKNQGTGYGRKWGFADIANSDDFRSKIPVIKYDDIASDVERAMNGEINVLTADKPLMFNMTSGTSSNPKFIPITPAGRKRIIDSINQWLCRALVDHPGLFDHGILYIAGSAIEGHTRSGIPYGSASGMIFRDLPGYIRRIYVLPQGIPSIKNYDLRYFAMARHALESRVSFVTTPNATTLTRLANIALQHCEILLKSIHDGTLDIPESLRAEEDDIRVISRLAAQLKPNPERAKELGRIAGKHGDLIPRNCWPNLKLIGCWLGGSVGYYADKLSSLYGNDIPRRDLGLIASEGVITIPSSDNTPSGILAIQNNYYEFIPEEALDQDSPPALACHELEKGKCYKVILTNENGLYRYDIGDLVQVDGFYSSTPVVSFIRKTNDMLNITGEKVHLNHFNLAFRKIAEENGISIGQYRVVPDLGKARYEVFVQISPIPDSQSARRELLNALDRHLSALNIEYSQKRASDRLNIPRIHFMKDDWEDSVRKWHMTRGKRDVQYKWQPVLDTAMEIDRINIRFTEEA